MKFLLHASLFLFIWFSNHIGISIEKYIKYENVVVDTVVNHADVSSKMKGCVDIYNGAMGLIGVYHVGKGVVNFAKSLPDATKNLLRENKSLKDIFTAQYIKWKEFTANLDNFTPVEKELLAKQEQVWRMLGVAEDTKNIVRKFTLQQIDEYVALATKQNDKTKVMLGMWDGGGVNSYISKAEKSHTYFHLGDKWSELYNFVNKNDDEIWRINKEFIDRQKIAGKEFWFSHDPYSPKNDQYFAREVNYLIDLGVKDFQKVGDLWRAVW